MKALTVKKPWADCIIRGEKNIENRSRSTSHRGLIAIHASLRIDRDGIRDPHVSALFGDDLTPGVPVGHVIAVAEIVGVCSASRADRYVVCRCGMWARPGAHHWQIANTRPLPEPIAARGALGLWTLPADIEHQVLAQLGATDTSSAGQPGDLTEETS
ncbi:ASCH domain-containing protein [Catenuloplanes japonicus]|uniref:ASCH domain-containing protein n=1 Tax=Catenuloplanes japonicus TaxID=33876 RepID=UPI00068E1592|nr:ASCH domain-containing protein [Catenuloplanes japonicus]